MDSKVKKKALSNIENKHCVREERELLASALSLLPPFAFIMLSIEIRELFVPHLVSWRSRVFPSSRMRLHFRFFYSLLWLVLLRINGRCNSSPRVLELIRQARNSIFVCLLIHLYGTQSTCVCTWPRESHSRHENSSANVSGFSCVSNAFRMRFGCVSDAFRMRFECAEICHKWG